MEMNEQELNGQETKELNPERLEEAPGGNFIPNKYSESEYASAGIKVVKHVILCDEFWRKGENIGVSSANAVMCFLKQKGRMPESVKEAESIKKTPSDWATCFSETGTGEFQGESHRSTAGRGLPFVRTHGHPI